MRRIMLVMSAALLLTAAGCSSNNNTGTMAMNSAIPAGVATGTATSPLANAQTVNVTLSEYTVQLDRSTIPAGPVHFVVTNKGQRGHQFQIYPQSAAPMMNHKMTSLVIPGTVGYLAIVTPGTAKAIDVTLPAGAWEVACHLEDSEAGKQFDHYDKGMKASLTVGS